MIDTNLVTNKSCTSLGIAGDRGSRSSLKHHQNAKSSSLYIMKEKHSSARKSQPGGLSMLLHENDPIEYIFGGGAAIVST